MGARFTLSGLAACLTAFTGVYGAEQRDADYFERHVRPLLAEHCYACHSNRIPAPQAGLRVDSRAALLAGGKTGPALLPGDPDGSLLLRMLRNSDGVRMPPTGKLADEQIRHFETWIRMGAPFPNASGAALVAEAAQAHWAFIPPERREPPPSASGWAISAIDRFVEAGLAQAGLDPSKEADPRTLIRRASLDLTGLPPSPEASDAFAESPTQEAYESIVDSLLASKQFGQRWARHWLDVTRYSDEGVQSRPFPISWTYRDWVVDAFNDDLPFDEFVRLQLAADLAGADRDQLPALGMLTVGVNLVRPTDVPENIDDRIDVVTRGLLGLSVACARCHDHKFDPIPQSDYYSLYGVFLNSPNVLEPVPIEVPPPGPMTEFFRDKLAFRREWLDRFRQERLADHVKEFRKPEILAKYMQAAWESRESTNRDLETLSKERDLNLYLLHRWRRYLNNLVGPAVGVFADLDAPGGAARLAKGMVEADSVYRWPDVGKEMLRLALRGNGSPTDIPVEEFWWIQNEGDSNVMKGLKWQYEAAMHDWSYRGGPRHAMVVTDAAVIQPAYLFVRGNQHDKGDEVTRRFLSALPGPREFRSGSGRLELAQAMASRSNPLTARVFVNRVWGHLFGEGIVRTPSDFGVRGDAPSHPRLLDFLASEFMAEGWSTKKLIRQIVLSKTYRQASADMAAGVAADPSNRLLWRQNRTRLDFEALRDSMLAVAGRLDATPGGPPFDLRAAPSSPRRSLYAYISREEPSALMRAFDFSNPEEHAPRRQLTTVPQQALFLMNSSFLAEQARALAARCQEAEACVDALHRRVLGRPPGPRARREALDFLAGTALEPSGPEPDSSPADAWLHGIASLDVEAGAVRAFERMGYRVEDRLQPGPMLPGPTAGRASLTASGGHPGDSLETAVVRRWRAPRSMRVTVRGKLDHPMGEQAERFEHSNGIRGWIVSGTRGILATWSVRGYEVDTAIKDLPVTEGEHLDFVVDSRGDYEADTFRWSPEIEEVLSDDQRRASMEPRIWSAVSGFPAITEQPLTPVEQYAQVLLMTNEFAFRD